VPKHLILNAVGLSQKLLNSGHMPQLAAYAKEIGGARAWTPQIPAVTASVQADLMTGATACEHGIVGNGWYCHEFSEVKMWPQSANLIDCPTIFDHWRKEHPDSSSAQLFWWWNLPSRADFSVTPRPTYYSDGRKGPDIHTNPPTLRTRLRDRLGDFPLFNFWGPAANIKSTKWIVDATLDVLREEQPGLCLSYLPHLDYDLQRFGPNSQQATIAAKQLDDEIARLLKFAKQNNILLSVVSEYGIEEVQSAFFPNRILREENLLSIHPAQNGSLLDPGNSRAFAICDHQCAHVYIQNEQDIGQVERLFAAHPEIEEVLNRAQMTELGINHPRCGELLLVAKKGHWFAYPFWLANEPEPDFARNVDIHQKTGYDPCELFLDPELKFPKLRIGLKLIAKKLGMRAPMNFIPLDASLVKGSHGRRPSSPEEGPVFIAAADCPLKVTE